ncbi:MULTISPECIES: MFS transporter [unclassified Cedecea]|uniref:MFS transporter n=1 Tax=unclassified Cedecea TaxID=2649846 RepID=UPI003019D8CB
MSGRVLTVYFLLASSFLSSISRAMIAPVLVLTLGKNLHISFESAGLLLGGALLVSSGLGVYGGYWLDRLSRSLILRLCGLVMAVGWLLLGWMESLAGVLFVLTLSEVANTFYAIGVKASLSDLVPQGERTKVFSLRYTLINVAWATGPLLTTFVLSPNVESVYLAAGVCSLLGVLFQPRFKNAFTGNRPESFLKTLSVLARDRVLIWFTLSTVFAWVVMGRFSDYLPLWFLTSMGKPEAMRFVSVLISCNSLTVILLQYPVSLWLLHRRPLIKLIVVGFALLAAAITAMGELDTLPGLCVAMFVFSLGEIILIPSEYIYIDDIAPEALKASYYGAQNLSSLGSSLGPMVFSLGLMAGLDRGIFLLMGALCLAGMLLALYSERVRLRQAPGTLTAGCS